MNDTDSMKQTVCDAIDAEADQIVGLGEAIMDEPELGFKETKTAARVEDLFQSAGLQADSGLALTGVRAVLDSGRPGPTVALMGELDALIVPDHPRCDAQTGAAHACGHNAQIAGMVGAAIGVAAADLKDRISGRIVFFAVPAEEYVEIDYRLGLVREGRTSFLAGKPELVKLGAFDDIDMAIMIHTGSADSLEGAVGVSGSSNGFLAKTARFVGKAAHAGVAPEQGINALNAATLALNAINAQRETFRDQDCVRVHPILTKAGDIVNIVPAEVRMETYVRARTSEAMLDAAAKVDRSLKAAAIAFGCTVEVETVPGYLPLANDEGLAEVFRETTTALFGDDAYRELPHSGGSTDAGDLSQLMPVLHPVMTGARGIVHGKDWHIADTDDGYLAPAKTMAMMAVELLSGNAHKAKRVMDAFEPAMTKTDYLRQQQEIFRTDVHDGASLV